MTRKHNANIYKRQAGVTLLEMIIVLAIIGMCLMTYANYKRKEAQQSHQLIIADMIVRDISGVMRFIAQTNLNIVGGSGTESNPLYMTKNAAIVPGFYDNRVTNKALQDEPENNSNYFYSGWSTNITRGSNVTTDRGSRYLFLGQECSGSEGGKGALPFKLTDTMLPCELRPGADSLELVLERVDFVNNNQQNTSTSGPGIERVDFYIAYQTDAENEGLHFAGFIKPLEKALKSADLGYLQAVVVEVSGSGNGKTFKLVKNAAGQPLQMGEVPNNMDLLDSNGRYGIRLSLNKSSEDLPADGSIPAAKMCWNDAKGEAGPCITALDEDRLLITSSDAEGKDKDEPAMCWSKEQKASTLCLAAMDSNGVNPDVENPDDRILHLRTSSDNTEFPSAPSSLKGTTGTLYANIVMENTSRRHPEKWHVAYDSTDARALKDGRQGGDNSSLEFLDAFRGQYELVTPTITFYQSFKNDYPKGIGPNGADDIYNRANNSSNYNDLLSEPGVIRLPLQKCPKVAGIVTRNENNNGTPLVRQLYPRLSVSISSVAADDDTGTEENEGYNDYTQQGATRANTFASRNDVGAVAGVVIQSNIVVNQNIARNNIPDRQDLTGGTFEDWIADEWFSGSGEKDEPFWLISATSATIDPDGYGTNKINPQSLSVVINQWCSTIPQGGMISSESNGGWSVSEPHKFLLHSLVAEDTDLKFYDNNGGSEIEFPDHERNTY